MPLGLRAKSANDKAVTLSSELLITFYHALNSVCKMAYFYWSGLEKRDAKALLSNCQLWKIANPH
jgi:hypothetical protein